MLLLVSIRADHNRIRECVDIFPFLLTDNAVFTDCVDVVDGERLPLLELHQLRYLGLLSLRSNCEL